MIPVLAAAREPGAFGFLWAQIMREPRDAYWLWVPAALVTGWLAVLLVLAGGKLWSVRRRRRA